MVKQRIGAYLIDTIHRAGVDKIFGVPGDFNLAFLDDIIANPHVDWVGNTNELNASYAADGYARINGLGALVTTFGVGELSAVNGIAGSYAERVPVVAITGAPTRQVERAGKYVHHSLGEGSFDDYRHMFAHITTAQGYITPDNATTEIPRLIDAAINERRPVHIHLPIDVALTEIEITESYKVQPQEDVDASSYIQQLTTKLASATQLVIITGHEINSFHLHEELEAFVNETNIPVAQLSLGKGAFNEENPHYLGIYDGKIAEDNVRQYVDHSDLILNIGAKLTDSATAGFSYQFNLEYVVMLNHKHLKIDDITVTDVPLPSLLRQLRSLTYHNQASFPSYQRPEIQHNTFIGQPLWGSIGYTLPATLGSQLANQQRRNLLLIGDGSLQLTVQSLSTMIKHHINPVIFVINNDGYTVERLIHGMHEPYNDIHMWDYKALPAVFGGKDVHVHDVSSSHDLQETFDSINNQPDVMHFVEVKMAVEDAPQKLTDIAKAFSAQNK